MHILELPSFFPPYGGTFCIDQAKALALSGHEVRILSNVQLGLTVDLRGYLCLPFGRQEREVDGIGVVQSYQRGLPMLVRFNVNRWLGIVRSMFADYQSRYGRPDIIHAHCAKWAGRAAMLISRDYGIPYVITEHLSRGALELEFGPAPSKAWQIPLLKEAYAKAPLVIPVSEELVADVACYYGRDYRWVSVSNTIDTSFYHYQPRKTLEGRRFRFCCLADNYYRKGYDVLLPAFRLLAERVGESVELHIAGRFTDKADFKAQLTPGIMSSYGLLDRNAVRQLLYASDALVLPSRSEVQPLVLLEAMSTGIPVVTTEAAPGSLRLEGASHVVPIDNADALADAMHDVLANYDRYDGQAMSRQVAELASPEVIGRKLSELFSGVLSDVSRRQPVV